MNSVLKLFLKTFVIPFYILNAGSFLLSFILIFGIVHPPQLIFIHISLIKGIINSGIFTSLVLSLWMLYNVKCILFCLRVIKRQDDTVFFNLQSVTAARQWILLFISHCILYLPIIIYSCFIVLIAYQQGFVYYCAGIVLFQLIVCVLAVVTYYININFTWKHRSSVTSFLPYLNLFRGKLRRPLYLFYYTLHSRKIIFCVTEISDLFLLNIILGTEKEYFTMRDFSVVFMIVVLIHALLVYYYVALMEKRMNFSRNMPVLRIHRFLLFFITYLLVLLPEFFFILLNRSGLITCYSALIFYSIAVAQLSLFTSILYVKSMKMKSYLKLVFCIYLASTMLMLTGSYEIISVINLSLAFLFFFRNFYRYEVEL